MFKKNHKKRIQNLKLCGVLLWFILLSFFILTYGFLKTSMLPHEFDQTILDRECICPNDLKYKVQNSITRGRNTKINVYSISDTVIKNIFVAFKYVEDNDLDNTNYDVFKNTKYKALNFDVFHMSTIDLDYQLWYKVIVLVVVFIIMLELVLFSIKHIMYIHKADGKKEIISINS